MEQQELKKNEREFFYLSGKMRTGRALQLVLEAIAKGEKDIDLFFPENDDANKVDSSPMYKTSTSALWAHKKIVESKENASESKVRPGVSSGSSSRANEIVQAHIERVKNWKKK